MGAVASRGGEVAEVCTVGSPPLTLDNPIPALPDLISALLAFPREGCTFQPDLGKSCGKVQLTLWLLKVN